MSSFTDKMKGKMNILKGKLKQEYAELTDDDFVCEEGKEDEMLGKIQKKIGKSKEEFKSFVDKL